MGCFGSRATANGLMAVLEDFRLVSVSPQLQPLQPSPRHNRCGSWLTRPLRNRPEPRQSTPRQTPKSRARTTTGLVRRVYEEGPCRIKRNCAASVPYAGLTLQGYYASGGRGAFPAKSGLHLRISRLLSTGTGRSLCSYSLEAPPFCDSNPARPTSTSIEASPNFRRARTAAARLGIRRMNRQSSTFLTSCGVSIIWSRCPRVIGLASSRA